MKLATALSVTVVLTLSACGKGRPLPAFAFDKCDGHAGFESMSFPTLCATSKAKGMDMVIGVKMKGSNLAAELTNNEVGTTISAPPDKQNSTKLSLPMVDKLGSLTLDQIVGKEPVDLGVTFTIHSPRYAEASLKLPPMSLHSAFENVETAEQVLVKNKLGLGAAAPAKHSTFFAVQGYVVGDAKTLADIDWVALPVSSKMDESESCAYQTEKGEPVSKSKTVEVYTVKLVDRRTGNVIETKDFRAVAECPSSLSIDTTLNYQFDSASWKLVETWITEKMNAA